MHKQMHSYRIILISRNKFLGIRFPSKHNRKVELIV